jgi:isoleucyl-tRNA synthetase
MRRVEDIFDVWFDSAVASWATLGYPGKVDEWERLWPADFITEGQDQTRGWFYSQLGAATFAFGRAPYRSVLMHGFALDAEGRKMSKSLGNVVAPSEVVEKVGVDVLRLYVLSANAPWDDLKFNWDGVKTVSRTVNILWNVYRFPLPYMLLDGFVPEAEDGYRGTWIQRRYPQMPTEDRFIVSRVNTLTNQCSNDLADYQLHRVVRELLNFVLEDLSRWYVQLVRPRMWLEGEDEGKCDAYETLYYVLRRLLALLAPFAPHIAESCYRNLRLEADPESVHMLGWPDEDAGLVDPVLERATALVRSFDDAVQNARQAGKRKLRWPVRTVVVVTDRDEVEEAITSQNPVCRSRANSREVDVVRKTWDRIGWRAEPVMKALGPSFGRAAPIVKKLVEEADGCALKNALERDGSVVLGEYTLDASQVVFHESLPDGIFSAPMEGATVYVDVALDADLEGEGYARELIRRCQEMRRQLDLAVEDPIEVEIVVRDARIAALVTDWHAMIGGEVRATRLSIADTGELQADDERPRTLLADWDLDGLAVTIRVTQALNA